MRIGTVPLPGFFQGAMYVTYGLGTVVALHLACVPAVFRYSRVIWAHVNVGTLTP